MNDISEYKNRSDYRGFTLVELIIVVVILGIAAMIAVPSVSSAADIQVRSAANRLAADLEYAKNLAITHQQAYCIVFDESGESYEIHVDPEGADAVIDDPVGPGNFVVDFSADHNLRRVEIVSADFDSDTTVTFDYLGSPYHGKSAAAGDALNSGHIELTAGNFTLYVKIEPITGYITIDDTL